MYTFLLIQLKLRLSSGNRAVLFLAKAHKLNRALILYAQAQRCIKKQNEMEII